MRRTHELNIADMLERCNLKYEILNDRGSGTYSVRIYRNAVQSDIRIAGSESRCVTPYRGEFDVDVVLPKWDFDAILDICRQVNDTVW